LSELNGNRMIDSNDKMFFSIGISLCEDNFQIFLKISTSTDRIHYHVRKGTNWCG